jgi:hypothetical protein
LCENLYNAIIDYDVLNKNWSYQEKKIIEDFYEFINEVEISSNNLERLVYSKNINSDIVKEKINLIVKIIEINSKAAFIIGDLSLEKILPPDKLYEVNKSIQEKSRLPENNRLICDPDATNSIISILQE